MKSLQYSLSREEIEKYATIGFHLAVDNMEKNNILTEEQIKYYYKFTCVVLTRETIYDRLKKFFKKDDYPVIVVAVRGTADFTDLQAWLPVVLDKIAGTQRYIQDTQVLTDFQQDYLPTQYYYYATGHSLAGVIIDEWLKKGLILSARTYNPAIQEQDNADTTIDNYRVYATGDPLYKMFGRRSLASGTRGEVRQSNQPFGWDQAKQFALSPIFYFGKDILREHTWRNPVFQGGYARSIRRQER